jgi:predicted O-linked N-acetylglucosamine transferase (SPINDLY family)
MTSQINLLLQDAINNFKRNNFSEAKILLLKILDVEPQNFDSLNIIGVINGIENKHIDAINFFKKAQKIRPNYNIINFNLGKALSEIGNELEAIKYYKIAIKLDKNHLGSLLNFGKSLHQLERYDEALIYYDRALKLKPDYFEAHYNKANTLKTLKRYDEALIHYDQAIKLQPNYVDAHYNKAFTLNNKAAAFGELKRYNEALIHYDQTIKFKPDYFHAYNNKAIILVRLKRYNEALLYYDQAIKLKPDYFEAYNNRGTLFEELKLYDEAFFNYDKAIKLKSDYALPYYNKGNLFRILKRYDEALLNYEQAIKLKPDYEYLFGMILHMRMFLCDWQDFNVNVESLLLQINKNKKSSFCLPALTFIDSPLIHRKCSEIWINDKNPFNFLLGPISKSKRREKIRVGYYSEDFRDHPVANLVVELLELHRKDQFELFGFYYGPSDSSNMHKRVSGTFDRFFEVESKDDKSIALMSREMGIDIAVDLNGITGSARQGIFSYRAAPIQVNYLGYPGTIGAKYFDYIIADPILIPIESQKYYSEKIVYLPNSYQPNDRKRLIAKKVFTKNELGLPKESFVFCCFNSSAKITPVTFDGWMRILKATKGSVLWLLQDNSKATLNLRKEAQVRGIDPNRLIFAERMPLPEHLARHRAADLFLDTLPYNAHTTTSDALWAELPVLTCIGKSFPSRVAASLLNAIELPELITTTQEQYEALAIELAIAPEKLRSIKKKLERNKLTTALFDTPRFSKHIEAAYKQMYERYQADLSPNNIYIKN